MSRHQPGSPADSARGAEDQVALPGVPAEPPVPPPSMRQAFMEMGEALAQTEVAPAWRATNHYVDDTESTDNISGKEPERPFAEPSRLRQVREFFAARLGSRRLARRGLLRKPSRETVVRASIGVLAAFAGWSAGAKPWQGATELEPPPPVALAVVSAPQADALAARTAEPTKPDVPPQAARGVTTESTRQAASATLKATTVTRASSTTTAKTTTAQSKALTARGSKTKSATTKSGKARTKAKSKRK